MKIKGQIICARKGRYTIELSNGEVIQTGARGKIKYNKDELLTGDYVYVDDELIVERLPRVSRFMRPNIANLQCLVIVISDPPKPDYLILDKLLLAANYNDIEYALVVNKTDLGLSVYDYIKKDYPFISNLFAVSLHNNDGIDELVQFIKGKSVAFAGQSAVGKTSLLNKLTHNTYLTGDISDKTQRGKHTTTYSRIVKTEDFSLFDTPGFSELSVDISPENVASNFPPYDKYLGKCKFPDCTHISEPECSVLADINSKILSDERHKRYNEIYKTIKAEYKKRKYDK